jgi:hypothetical protein
MTTRGPLVTLAVAAVAGTGLWLVNVSQSPDQAPARGAAVISAQTTAPQLTPSPLRPQFPSAATYSDQIVTAGAPIALDVSIDGGTARAYACDNYAIETWLSGPATNGAVNLVSQDRSSRLEASLRDRALVGTLSIGDRSWDFTAPVVTDAQ